VSGFVVTIVVFGVIALISGAVKASAGAGYDGLIARGVAARGILLSVSRTGTRGGTSSRPFQRRDVMVDVEIPGRAPFLVTTSAWIPLNLVGDVVPGATVELRVDPARPQNIAIIGPGAGFAPATVIDQQGAA